jgi:hypothetical protein
MAMLDLIDDGGELVAVPAVQTGAEDLGNLVGGEPPQAEFTTSLEQLVDGKVALENKVTAILDLADGIGALWRRTSAPGSGSSSRAVCG